MANNIVNSNRCVVGSHIFFVENGVPHTGIVKEVFENKYVLSNVTFLKNFYDKTEWIIDPKDAYKTNQIYLPQFPTQAEINKVSQFMHSYSLNRMLTDVDYNKVIEAFPKRKLMTEKNSIWVSPVVSIGPYSVLNMSVEDILNKDSTLHPIYRVNTFRSRKTRDLIRVVEKYKSNIFEPDDIYIPEWKDVSRMYKGSMDELRQEVDNYYELKYLGKGIASRVMYKSIINEDTITSVYSISPFTVAWMQLDERPLHHVSYKPNEGLFINHRFYEKDYIKS